MNEDTYTKQEVWKALMAMGFVNEGIVQMPNGTPLPISLTPENEIAIRSLLFLKLDEAKKYENSTTK